LVRRVEREQAMSSKSIWTLTTVLAVLLLTTAPAAAQAPVVQAPNIQAPVINIVAIGASNTWGWGVFGRNAYPERLEDLLLAQGYDARVLNAGVIFDTTASMLRRLDRTVPEGTHIVILQPGGNDVRFYVSLKHRDTNIGEMVERLRARNIEMIVYDPVFPPNFYQWDRIHITAAGHGKIAAELLARVAAIVGPARR
jgi:acyl-CoA thioesterase-1